MRTCSEVMTRNPVCCSQGDTADKAARLMKTSDIGAVPVIDNAKTNKLVGIVTDRDLTVKVVAEGRDPKTVRIGDVMTHDPVTCEANEELESALDAMAGHQIRRIPVVDHSGRIIGIIAQADVATRVDEPVKTAEVLEEISKSNPSQS